MLCLIQNLLKITIFSVVIDRKRNEKIECIRGIKWLNLASTLVGKWGKEFWICSVSKTGRRRTASHQIGSYAILCSFRKTGERLGGWILKIVSDLQKKKEKLPTVGRFQMYLHLECWHHICFTTLSLRICTYIFFLSLLRLNYRCDPNQKMTLRKCSHLINRHLDFTNHPWSPSRISHHL